MALWITDDGVQFIDTEITWVNIYDIIFGELIKALHIPTEFLSSAMDSNFKAAPINTTFYSSGITHYFKATD